MADLEGRLSPSCLEDIEDEALDPRIQVELERLNRASEDINKLELELDDSRAVFRQALTESTHKLDVLAKKLGTCVDKARPYYDARVKAKEVHVETQKAAYMYERACSMHEAAKEMVQLAEQGYMQREDSADPAWQEMLNHATMKVNDAEMERHESEKVHRITTQKFNDAEERVLKLQKDLKRSINKSKLSIQRSFLRMSDIVNQFDIEFLPYFEMKAKFNQVMEDRKRSVNDLELNVSTSKKTYSDALRKLEEISEDIHRQRLEAKNQAELGVREAGVGSESPSPPPMRGKDPLSIDGTSTQIASSCNPGFSVTTTTSSLSSDNTFSSPPDFRPNSIIYSSPEKARSQSYRDAIEARHPHSSDSSRLPEVGENFRVNLEEEYLSLPPELSPRSQRNNNGISSAGDEVFNDGAASDGKSSSPRHISYPSHANIRGDITDSKLISSSGESSPLSSSPSALGKKSSAKLKGLILTPVGAGLDPLQANLRINTRENSQRARSGKFVQQKTDIQDTKRPASYPYSHNTQQEVAGSRITTAAKNTRDNQRDQIAKQMSAKVDEITSAQKGALTETEEIIMKDEMIKREQAAKMDRVPDLLSPCSDKMYKRLLKVPSLQDFDEGSVSDTESITSGTMLDDEQVEFLTMDFSQQKLSALHDTKVHDRERRKSLPPNLSYLETYMRKLSDSHRPGAAEDLKVSEEESKPE